MCCGALQKNESKFIYIQICWKTLFVMGRFITIEGGEGTGKSTQLALLSKKLNELGIKNIITREPGGSSGAELIRKILVNGPVDKWQPVTEALLHYAARNEHLKTKILPTLEKDIWVLCDRFSDSTTVYQGVAQGVPVEIINTLNKIVVEPLEPDLTIILDLTPEIGLKRAKRRGGDGKRYEKMEFLFHKKLRLGFAEIAKNNPKRCVLIDAKPTIEEIAVQIGFLVENRLLKNETSV